MKITALVENTSAVAGIGAEHGLSLYIESKSEKILFDMGQTNLFSENAQKLGVDLSKVDFAVLSHGHYDHGGGLSEFLRLNKSAKVYLNENAFGQYYNGTEKYIGLDFCLKNHSQLTLASDEFKIKDGFTLYSCNSNKKYFDLGSFGLNMKHNDELLPDAFLHEHYLLIEEDGKRVLISGCSHKGILNIVKWFNVDVVIGGFHFSKLPLDNTLRGYAELLGDVDCEFYTCHCTGVEQYEFMKKYMSNLHYLSSGQIVVI